MTTGRIGIPSLGMTILCLTLPGCDRETKDATRALGPTDKELLAEIADPRSCLRVLNSPSEAQHWIDLVEARARATGQEAAAAACELWRARCDRELRLFKDAVAHFEHYFKSSPNAATSGIRTEYARALLSAGLYARADSAIASLVELARQSHDTRTLAMATNIRGSSRIMQAQGDSGLMDYTNASLLAKKRPNDLELHLDILDEQCDGYSTLQRLDSLFSTASRAIALAEEARDTLHLIRAELDAGLALNNAADAAGAMPYTARAADLARLSHNERDRLFAEYRLAYHAWNIVPYEETQEKWRSLLRNAEEGQFLGVAATIRYDYARNFLQVDSAYFAMHGLDWTKRFDIAREQLKPALTMAEVTGQDELYYEVLSGFSLISNWEGRYDDALKRERQVLVHARSAGRVRQQVLAFVGITSNLYAKGEWQRSTAAADSGYALARTAGMKRQMAQFLSTRSYCQAHLRDFPGAYDARMRRDTLRDVIDEESGVKRVVYLNAEHRLSEQQMADSLAHTQELAVEKATSEARIQRQRTTTWSIAGIGALLLLGAGGYVLLDRRRRRVQFERDAAKLEKEAAAFETQALRSQMNPHFIFNALNSISGYIQGNDPDQAQAFLARFAKLMRAVLENSRFTEVPLAKDLEVLRTYMELERTRAQGKFDFSIEVEPGLDPNEVLVPPLVAQPFVENAIWHGIAGKTGKGHITLRIGQRGGQLVMEVLDDGVGMGKRTASPAKNKTSLGTHITRSRLDLVEKQKGRPAGYRYLEAATGTHVEIHLPLELAA